MKIGISLVMVLLFVDLSFGQVQTGKASFYSKEFTGRLTASGEKYNPNKFTAAHRHLPFGTKVRVTNLANNKTVVVKINDRGPFVGGRIIDLSAAAAKKLGFINDGSTDVVLKIVDGKSEDSSLAETSQKPSFTKQPEPAGKPEKDTLTEKTEKPGTTDEVPGKKLETQFYGLSVNRTEPKGFGIQIGSFQEAANLIRLTDNLKANYQKKVTVQVKTVEGTKIYSLIIGNFPSHKKAEAFEKKVEKKYPGCFVVNFSESEK